MMMLLAEDSIQNSTVEIAKLAAGLITTIFTGLMVYFMAKLNKSNERITEIEKTGKETHMLVNGQMSVQLKINSMSLRRVAELTKDDGDRDIAEQAEKHYQEHEKKYKESLEKQET